MSNKLIVKIYLKNLLAPAIFIFFFFTLILATLSISSAEAKCCRANNVHPEFNCSSLDTLGEGRCNAVWSGGIAGAGPCKWTNSNVCPIIPVPLWPSCCARVNTSHPEFNCSQLTPYGDPVGKNRCNAVWTGGIAGSGPCKWVTGPRCLIRPIPTPMPISIPQ
ncbi:MAG: hypothetical protein HQK49_11605 [Oligoflexia bacterium]|nr:hypothetical protein [Oligoflexia bacterium]